MEFKLRRLQEIKQETLKAGTKVQLPLWLGVALSRRELVDILPPTYMTQQYFNTLKAGSEVVTLNNQCSSIYQNVSKIAEFLEDERKKEAIELYQ